MADTDKSYGIAWQREVGLNHTPAYQVSGIPFASGSINCVSGAVRIAFPYVTRWVEVKNHDINRSLKVAFSEAGLTGPEHFVIDANGGAPGHWAGTRPLEVKISEIWISGSGQADVIAGLTSISPGKTSTEYGASWSGSSGVG